eukprot:NODE_100_length_20777_cov_0.240884.p4 type:complete len:335 gc:universal NODE_100_length_20777_cov_0.240884:7500-8504(+)
MQLLVLSVLAKSAIEREYDRFQSTHDTGQAVCSKDYLFKTLICGKNCKEFEIGCQRMVDDLDNSYSYRKQGTVTYDEIKCPLLWKCNTQYSCPTDRIISGIKCNGWRCKNPGVFCDKVVGQFGQPKVGDECFWTDKLNKNMPFRECPSGYVAKGISCNSIWCQELKLQCCPLYQANKDCKTSSWNQWSQCSDNKQQRSKTVISKEIGDGKKCANLSETQSCQKCVLGEWKAWSRCEKNRRIRIRNIIKSPYGDVSPCGPLQEIQSCASPMPPPKTGEKDCRVSKWGQWTKCHKKVQTRSRKIVQNPSKNGKKCPNLTESRKCCAAYGYNLSKCQ